MSDPRNAAYAALTEQGYLPTSKIDRMAVVDLVVTAVEAPIRADECERIHCEIDAALDGHESNRSNRWSDGFLGDVIQRERERIAAAIEAMPANYQNLMFKSAAARIARRGGNDE